MFRKMTLLLVALFLLLGMDLSFAQPSSVHGSIDCGACHVSSKPGHTAAQLKPCPRPADPGIGDEMASSPRMVILGSLENLYVPVQFDHKLHSSMSGMGTSCQTCHHYSKTAQFTPHACKECHPKDVIHENIAQPGLKGAYHRQCLGCHTEWDSQTSCEICHEKRQGGKLAGAAKTYSTTHHYKRVELQELIKIKTGFAEKDEVPFTHKLHATQYGKGCSICHKHEKCISCHSKQKELHPFGDTSKEDIHKTCNKCHEKNECTHCHGRDPKEVVFSHEKTGWSLKPIHLDVKCWQCHYKKDGFKKPDRKCATCHVSTWFPGNFKHESVGVPFDDIHGQFSCADCHEKGLGAGVSCVKCHTDGRKYDKTLGWKLK